MAASTRTHYDVLGISPDADSSAVRLAWKLHVQAWHPDRFTGEMRDEAERQTSRINEAYTTLRDGSRRAAYDCRLAADVPSAPTGRAARPAKTRPAAPRAASTPIGTPIALPEPMTLGEQFAQAGSDAVAALRRYPRLSAAAVSLFALLFVGSAAVHVLTGPSLPAAPATVRASSVTDVTSEETADLEELAERARAEAAEADAQLAELMRRDAAAAELEAQQAARAAAAQPAAAPKRGTKPPASPRGRVVRIMPNNR